MKLLITGALGQLGNEIRRLAERSTHTLVYTDRDELDITDASAVDAALAQGFDGVINCAAYTAVDKAESDRDTCYRLNSDAVENLAKSCRTHNLFLVHISTDFVFDGCHYLPYKEIDTPNPLSVYGDSKLQGEIRALAAHDRVSVIRTSWLYSVYGNNFVKTIRRLVSEREEIRIIFDQIGTPTSAYLLAHAIFDRLDIWKQQNSAVYHYSQEGVASWYDFAVAIGRLSHSPCRILPIPSSEYPTPARRPHYSVLDKSKIKQTLGITIPHWEYALSKTIQEIERGS